MFIAMKLVAVAQAGNMVDASQLNIGYPPPKLVRSVQYMRLLTCSVSWKSPISSIHASSPFQGEIPTAPTVLTPDGLVTQAPKGKWTMKPDEKLKYEQMYVACNPIAGKVPGSTVSTTFLLYSCFRWLHPVFVFLYGAIIAIGALLESWASAGETVHAEVKASRRCAWKVVGSCGY
jgi:hypothetical protein